MDYRNQTPEQQARDKIDTLLEQSGWIVLDKKKINLSASQGVAVREPTTNDCRENAQKSNSHD